MNKNIALETLKVLGIEAIDEAKSGHPGIVLGAAPAIYTLYTKHLKATATNSKWINRDRFVLSAGHGSALLYANLHLANYNVSLSDLKAFRQLNSITPGHPEVHLTDGVDASSGPLGQGISQAVGLAIAESHLNAKFPSSINHYTYVLCGDGDLQEGVAQEALSLAGHLNLNKLIILYDSNDIQLDGPVKDAFTESLALKMNALGWNYLLVKDGSNIFKIDEAIALAKESSLPTIIEIKTIIGAGSSKAGTSSAHGAPLAHDEVLAMRASLGGERFRAEAEAYRPYKEMQNKVDKIYHEWLSRDIEDGFDDFFNKREISVLDIVPSFPLGLKQATRVSSGQILKEIQKHYPQLIGGAADLSSSTHVMGADGKYSPLNRLGRDLKFGVREHAMAAISNGIALYGGFKPFCGGFFVFSDYMKPALRLSSLMELEVLYIFTHDSLAVGEDGPTHQPIEQLTMLRSIPGLIVIRPADANEVRHAYQYALNVKGTPVVLVLTRQDIMSFIPDEAIALEKGAYIIGDESSDIDGIIIASGSEVTLACDAQAQLLKEGIKTRLVNIPSTNIFDQQSQAYKDHILLPHITKRLAVEASDGAHMWRYVGLAGDVICLNSFGTSAKGPVVLETMGYTVAEVVNRYKDLK